MTTKTTAVLSLTLDTISLAEAETALRALDSEYGVVPDAAKSVIDEYLKAIVEKAAFIRLTSVHQLISNQPKLLKELTKPREVTAFTKAHPTDVAESLHAYRNVSTALAAAAAAMNGCDAQSVYANAVQLHKRSKELQRPLTHDEILLLRVYAAVASRHKATAEPANVYALADAGMTPGETTQVTLGDFDDPDHPTHVIAAGHAKGLESRFLPLDDFGQRVLARRTRAAVADGSPRHATLTYRPRKNLPGTPAATASSQGVLDRILSTVGLKAADVTASSIGLWRVRTTMEEHGPAAAQELSGRSTAEQMLASINKDLTTEYTEEDEDEIHSLTAA